MKKIFAILLAALLALAAHAGDRRCFFPGEVSEYKITWMGIPLAWSKTTTDTIEENGRELIRLRMVSQNYKAYSYIYRVDDAIEVVIDPKTALPLRLDYRLREGSRKISQLTLFDHGNKTATTTNRIENTVETVAIEGDTRDIYTLIYTMRNMDWDDLFNKPYTLFVEGKLYQLELVKHREKKISLPNYGKVESVEIEPLAEFDGLFLRKGKVMFWVSKADRRMITCIKTKVPVGKITVKLQQVTGPGDDFWVGHRAREMEDE